MQQPDHTKNKKSLSALDFLFVEEFVQKDQGSGSESRWKAGSGSESKRIGSATLIVDPEWFNSGSGSYYDFYIFDPDLP